MEYTLLKKEYYQNRKEYERLYAERYNSSSAHHIDFQIGTNAAFFIETEEFRTYLSKIRASDKRVAALCKKLPAKAVEQFSLRCLIDEIVVTNSIEGVSSTRREVGDVIRKKAKKLDDLRFEGLVRQYQLLGQEDLSLKTCEDVRRIYDELVSEEVIRSDPNNAPDGAVFRKESVSVYSNAQKEIHRGLYPESRITEAMTKALAYLNDESEELLYRAAVFHYLLGYIHPFYDGNGRLNRFISSYMLSRELEPILGYRLSCAVKENIKSYNDAFVICNDPTNKGDLTPFVTMFLEKVYLAVSELADELENGQLRREKYRGSIWIFPCAEDKLVSTLYDLLIQAELFSENGISTKELVDCTDKSDSTLRRRLKRLEDAGLLKSEKIKNEKYYGIDLDALDDIIGQS